MVQKDGNVNYECKGIGYEDGICPQNKIPTLNPNNRNTWGLFLDMIPGLITETGFDYTAIKVVFEIEKIETEKQIGIFHDILKLINVVRTEKDERQKRNS